MDRTDEVAARIIDLALYQPPPEGADLGDAAEWMKKEIAAALRERDAEIERLKAEAEASQIAIGTPYPSETKNDAISRLETALEQRDAEIARQRIWRGIQRTVIAAQKRREEEFRTEIEILVKQLKSAEESEKLLMAEIGRLREVLEDALWSVTNGNMPDEGDLRAALERGDKRSKEESDGV